MEFPIEKVFDYGVSGLALGMFFYLNITWQKTIMTLNQKWEQIIINLKESIDNCPGNRGNKVFRQ